MKPEALTVTIRPRVPFEAIDLGLALAQTYAKPVYAAWAVVLIPVMLLAGLLSMIWPEQTWLFTTIVWWLKPMYDRVILHVLSHAVFGEIVNVRQVMKALPAILRPGLFRALTWARFSTARSFLLPVWQLEGLEGASRRQRIALLRKGGGDATWLTIACVHIEGALMFSALALAFLMVPAEVGLSPIELLFEIEDEPLWLLLLQYASYLTALLLVEPVFVASGFTLYLNRRTELESWDIELAFHKIAARLAEQKRRAA